MDGGQSQEAPAGDDKADPVAGAVDTKGGNGGIEGRRRVARGRRFASSSCARWGSPASTATRAAVRVPICTWATCCAASDACAKCSSQAPRPRSSSPSVQRASCLPYRLLWMPPAKTCCPYARCTLTVPASLLASRAADAHATSAQDAARAAALATGPPGAPVVGAPEAATAECTRALLMCAVDLARGTRSFAHQGALAHWEVVHASAS